MGDSVRFWKDLYAHPNLDDWWKARNTRNFVQHIPTTANTLVVGGLFDAEDVFGAWNLYKAIEEKSKTNNKLVMGPWFHGQWGGRGDGSSLGNVRFGSKTSEWYQNNIEVPFFNYHLKGKGDISKLAEATVFFQWRKQLEAVAEMAAAEYAITKFLLSIQWRTFLGQTGCSGLVFVVHKLPKQACALYPRHTLEPHP